MLTTPSVALSRNGELTCEREAKVASSRPQWGLPQDPTRRLVAEQPYGLGLGVSPHACK